LQPLGAIDAGRDPAPPHQRIAAAVRDYGLPTALLRDLVDAFKQDVLKKRYATYADLLDYSRRSAEPVGRLVLHVFERCGLATGSSREQSDAICSALQQINFWQDVEIDWRKGRVYIPQEDLARFGVEERQIAQQRVDERWRALMGFECARSRELLTRGAPMARSLPGRFGLEIRAAVAGVGIILDKIEAAGGDVFRHRPVLNKLDWARIVGKLVSETIFPRAP
jgi:squalene synthase HpnC